MVYNPFSLVLMAVRVHPFPSRTRQLSSLAPKILGWKRPGKIGGRQHQNPVRFYRTGFLFDLPMQRVGEKDCNGADDPDRLFEQGIDGGDQRGRGIGPGGRCEQ